MPTFWRYRWRIAFAAIILLAAAIRFHNAFVYNPYWGYDGGAHIEYVRFLADRGRLPLPAENYQAWHAPLFYIISAGIFNLARLVHPYPPPWIAVQVFQALVGTAFVGLSGLLAWETTRRRGIALATTATIATLPIAVFTGSYISNELLAQALIVGILVLAMRLVRAEKYTLQPWIPIGLLIGIAFLIKYTAVLLLPPIALTLLAAALKRRSAQPIGTLVAILSIAIALTLPWQIYRARVFGSAFNLNAVEEARLAEERDRGAYPVRFFLTFDRAVLTRPFWDSGARGIWSFLYGQVFGDYDNLFGNVDRDNTLPADQKTQTTNGRFVSFKRLAANRSLLRFSLVFLPLLVLGIAHFVLRITRSRLRLGADLLLGAFVATTLAATIVYALRYPFLERGTIKAMYVLSTIPVLFLWGWMTLLAPRPRLLVGIISGVVLATFVIFTFPVVWITSG